MPLRCHVEREFACLSPSQQFPCRSQDGLSNSPCCVQSQEPRRTSVWGRPPWVLQDGLRIYAVGADTRLADRLHNISPVGFGLG